MRKKFGLISIALLFFSSCQESHKDHELHSVFDDDRRVAMPRKVAPFSQVGLVYLDKRKVCTGSIVAPNIAITSAHCLAANHPSSLSKIYFYVGFQKGSYKDVSGVSDIFVGTKFPLKDRSRDWAFLLLKKPLGKRTGIMKIQVVPDHQLRNIPIWHAGFSADFLDKYGYGSVDPHCVIKYGYNNLLRHNCDSLTGASGGPLWVKSQGSVRMIGIHVASAPCQDAGGRPIRCPIGVPYNHNIASYGVSAGSFINKLRELYRGKSSNLLRLKIPE